MKSCAVCGGEALERLLEAPDYPAYLVPLPPALAPGVVRAPLVLWACRGCGHMQQVEPDAEVQRKIYEVYYAHYVVDAAEALVPAYRQPFEAFLHDLTARKQLPRGALLEIGCSTGERAPFFAGFAESYTGVDPSPRLATARARHPQHRFVQGYFPGALTDGGFDVVVSQFNLEHILDLGAFLTAVHGKTRDGAVLIVQVPDIGAFERNAQPNFLAHEHVQYFRREALDVLMRRHGFAPFAWGPDGASLICAARRVAPDAAAGATGEVMAGPRRHAALFDLRPALPEGPLVFYGVGPLLYWMLGSTRAGQQLVVVDDNPAYRDQGLPGYDLCITQLDAALLRRVPTVVLSLNPIYHERVLDKLRALQTPARVLALRDGTWTTITLP